MGGIHTTAMTPALAVIDTASQPSGLAMLVAGLVARQAVFVVDDT